MAVSASVADRLMNWKFESAAKYMFTEINIAAENGEPSPYVWGEQETINALAQLVGNCGWMEGGIADVIRGAVAWVLGQPVDSADDWLPEVLRNSEPK